MYTKVCANFITYIYSFHKHTILALSYAHYQPVIYTFIVLYSNIKQAMVTLNIHNTRQQINVLLLRYYATVHNISVGRKV